MNSVDIQTKLTKLRQEYKNAIGVDREIIVARANLLKYALELHDKYYTGPQLKLT